MSNRIGKLVKEIQYKTDLTIEQIADKINYSRSHLNRLAKKGDSEKLFQRLTAEFGAEIAQNVITEPQGPPDLITGLLRQQNNLMVILTDVIKGQKEAVVDKVGEIDTNLKIVTAQAESLKYDLVSGQTTVLRSLSRLEGKPVDYLLKEADSIRIGLVRAKDESYKKHEKRRIGNTGS